MSLPVDEEIDVDVPDVSSEPTTAKLAGTGQGAECDGVSFNPKTSANETGGPQLRLDQSSIRSLRAHREAGDHNQAARIELAREYCTNPVFRKALAKFMWGQANAE